MSKVAADRRIDPRIRAAAGGENNPMEVLASMPQIPSCTSREELMNFYMEQMGEIVQKLAASTPAMQPTAETKALWSKVGLSIERKKIVSAPDGNKISIGIVRPAAAEQKLPLIVYFHGGGMALGSAFDPPYTIWARMLARQGVAVAMVDFRNCLVPSMSNQEVKEYPAGLNDCYSGLVWCHEHAAELNVDVSRICIAGESGGGNLAIATALKCKREGRLDLIPNGFFALCPYIAGVWPQNADDMAKYPEEVTSILGTSHVENHGIILAVSGDTNVAMGYNIDAFRSRDALAWPGMATVDELRGLPRCVISVNECDPLRDEGVNFYRRLLDAGVNARCRMVMGTPHGADLMATAAPDIVLDTARSLADFAFGDATAHMRRPLPPALAKL